MVKQGVVIGIIAVLILVALVMFTPIGKIITQATIGQQFEEIGISCQQVSDCESFLRNQGASDEDIQNINFRCSNNQCEIQVLEPSKERPVQ